MVCILAGPRTCPGRPPPPLPACDGCDGSPGGSPGSGSPAGAGPSFPASRKRLHQLRGPAPLPVRTCTECVRRRPQTQGLFLLSPWPPLRTEAMLGTQTLGSLRKASPGLSRLDSASSATMTDTSSAFLAAACHPPLSKVRRRGPSIGQAAEHKQRLRKSYLNKGQQFEDSITPKSKLPPAVCNRQWLPQSRSAGDSGDWVTSSASFPLIALPSLSPPSRPLRGRIG